MTEDLISRQAAIDAINTWDKFGVDERNRIVRWHEGLEPYVHLRDVVIAIVNLPSAQPSLLDALEIIDQFLHSCRDSLTCEIVTPNGMKLHTDWGYFSEGIDELRRYAEGEKDD